MHCAYRTHNSSHSYSQSGCINPLVEIYQDKGLRVLVTIFRLSILMIDDSNFPCLIKGIDK